MKFFKLEYGDIVRVNYNYYLSEELFNSTFEYDIDLLKIYPEHGDCPRGQEADCYEYIKKHFCDNYVKEITYEEYISCILEDGSFDPSYGIIESNGVYYNFDIEEFQLLLSVLYDSDVESFSITKNINLFEEKRLCVTMTDKEIVITHQGLPEVVSSLVEFISRSVINPKITIKVEVFN